MVLRVSRLTLTSVFRRRISTLPRPPNLDADQLNATPENVKSAKAWVEEFKKAAIPKKAVEVNFVRSSGPGGQNVNKVNTKAVVRCMIHASWIPKWARSALQSSPFYVPSSGSLLVKSDVSRSQSSNCDDGLQKLHTIVLSASSSPIKTEPSPEQVKRVEQLSRIAKRRNKISKMRLSAKKKSRSSKF